MDKRKIGASFTAEKEEGESDFFDALFKKDDEIEDILDDEDELDDIED